MRVAGITVTLRARRVWLAVLFLRLMEPVLTIGLRRSDEAAINAAVDAMARLAVRLLRFEVKK